MMIIKENITNTFDPSPWRKTVLRVTGAQSLIIITVLACACALIRGIKYSISYVMGNVAFQALDKYLILLKHSPPCLSHNTDIQPFGVVSAVQFAEVDASASHAEHSEV